MHILQATNDCSSYRTGTHVNSFSPELSQVKFAPSILARMRYKSLRRKRYKNLKKIDGVWFKMICLLEKYKNSSALRNRFKWNILHEADMKVWLFFADAMGRLIWIYYAINLFNHEKLSHLRTQALALRIPGTSALLRHRGNNLEIVDSFLCLIITHANIINIFGSLLPPFHVYLSLAAMIKAGDFLLVRIKGGLGLKPFWHIFKLASTLFHCVPAKIYVHYSLTFILNSSSGSFATRSRMWP